MYLKQFVYVNWGNIPSLEFDFGPVNLFSGGNGSGKTTAADAIQTVMTAAHENLFQYNPGQDETTQRGRGGKRVRTLASYVLGCDDGSYARLEPTDGYLAAMFEPTKGENGEPFTAIIAVRAWLDTAGKHHVARQDEAQFFIISGELLTLEHFVRQDKAGKYVTPLTELHSLLIKEFGKRGVEKYETKKAYLRRLYAAFRGKADAIPEAEAVGAARAFSRFMAYKPVKSIDRFVADEILEQRDLGEAVRSVSSQLKTIHSMEGDAAQLIDSINILEQAKVHSTAYIEQWIELNVLDYTLAQATYQAQQRDYLHVKQQQREQRQARQENETAIADTQQRLEQIRDQLISLEAQRQGVDALRQKDALEKQRQQLDAQLVEQARTVLEQDQIISANVQASRDIQVALRDAELIQNLPELTDLQTQAMAKKLIDTGKDALQDIHGLVQRDLAGQVPMVESRLEQMRTIQQGHNGWYQHWHEAQQDESRRDQLSAFVHTQRSRYQRLVEQRTQKRQEIDRLGTNQVTYPSHVERAIKAIRQQCPAADPRVLCDHVEVKDPRWQAAIEGYLGGARFSILVEPDYEAKAIRIVRGLPGRDNRAKIIQGDKAIRDAGRMELHTNSIVHVLEFNHAVASAYLSASYGTVQRVDSAEELRSTRRGVTEDGMASGGYSMWRCDMADSDLVFGAAARKRALAAKHAELQQIEQDWNLANDQQQRVSALLRNINSLQPSRYADSLAAILNSHRENQKIETLLSQLDLSAHTELEQYLEQLKQDQAERTTQNNTLNHQQGVIDKELSSIDKKILKISEHQDQNSVLLEEKEDALNAIAVIWPELDLNSRIVAADAEAQDLNLEHAQNYRLELEKKLRQLERKTAETIQQHNQYCRPADAITYTAVNDEYDASLFQAICGLQREIDQVYNILKNNILVERHQQLKELKEAFNDAFVTNLCHSIYQALNTGKRQIDLLNKELQHHQFGSDRETFRFASEWIPEYRDYARFFEELIKNPILGDEVNLFNAQLSEKSQLVRDELLAMLLDEDEQRAMRDLQRIADYRNYRRYEIYKEVEGKEPIPLSEYGTGSGGQLETPAYIIRAAAITSAFRFAEGNSHLRMVLVDEAFSKMDETRSREVINYLTDSLGLQLIFIMPTSKCGPYMDLISNEFVFAKTPSAQARGQLHTRVLVDRKRCNQERIKQLWENHRKTVYQQAELDFMQEILAKA